MNAASSDIAQQQTTNSTTTNGQHHPETPSERIDLLDYPNGGRILCVADIRGKISRLNELASIHKATAIIHTGDFGFYDKDSVERISDRTLRHVVQYSSLIDPQVREKHFPSSPQNQLSLGQMREKLLDPTDEQIADQKGVKFIISEFPKLVSGEIKLNVPVYAVYGACEDIAIIEKIRLAKPSTITTSQSPANQASQSISSSQEYSIHNLTILSEGVTRCIVTGGVRLRLFGLGGSLVHHKLFDNGEGAATIAGGNGVMWTTALQIGELIDTAQKVFDPSETRLLVTHGSIGKEGLLAQLALAIKADFTISGALHFRYGSSYNDFATQTDPDTFRAKFTQANKGFMEVYETVKTQIDQVIDDQQKKLLQNALAVARRIPNENVEEPAWKNSWHWNLPDAAYGTLVLDIKEGRVGSEMKNTGFNFAYRMKGNAQPLQSGNQQQRNNRPPFAQKPVQSPAPQQQPQQQSPSASTSQAQAPAMSANPSSTASSAQGAKPVNTTGAPSASAPSDAPPATSPTAKAPPSSEAFNNLASGFARKGTFQNNPSGGRGGFGNARQKGPGINHPREQYIQQGNRQQQHQASTSSASASSPVEKKEGDQNGSDPRPADPLPTPSSASSDWRTKPSGDGAKEGEGSQQPRRGGFNNNYNNRREGSGNWSNGQGDASSGGEGGAGRGSGSFRGRGRGNGGGFQPRNNNQNGSPVEGQHSPRGGPNNRGNSGRGDRGRGNGRGRGGFSSGDGAGAASAGQGQSSDKPAAPASTPAPAPSAAPAAAPAASS